MYVHMDLTINDLTNDLFQNFPLKSKKIDNDHFVLLKATIFLTLPAWSPNAFCNACIFHSHKSTFALAVCGSEKRSMSLQSKTPQFIIIFTHSPLNHPYPPMWTHVPCIACDVIMTVLVTRASNNLCTGERDFSSLTRMSTI